MLGEWPILGREQQAKVSVEGTINLYDCFNASFIVGVEHSEVLYVRGV